MKIKSRNIVPGWPRGRSTSRSWLPMDFPLMYAFRPISEQSRLDVFAWYEERRVRLADEQAKAHMVNIYWLEQKWLAIGEVPPWWDERITGSFYCGFGWWYRELQEGRTHH